MPKPDDSSLTSSQLARIRKEAERALLQAGALGVLPTPIDEIMRVARVREIEEDIHNPSFIDKIMGNALKAGQVVKRALSKVMGLFLASEGLVFIDRTLMVVRQRFVRLHESAHGFLPWQRPMYAVVQDCEHALDPDTAELFDREANMFASEVLFQLDMFHNQAEELPFGIFTPVNLAKRYNASVYAAIRQYVSKNHRTCVVLVLNPPEIDAATGFQATLRRVVASESFKTMFSAYAWAEVFTPDDDIGRLVPLGKRRASGKRQLGLTDDNGILQECVAESFSSGHQVFVLIHVNKALTSTRIILR
jgi:Zn-dependent peptidase ImmA (M78 family)